MNRPTTQLRLLLATAVACSLHSSIQANQPVQRPNIILCMGDDHGWDETGFNNHPHLKTPVLDQMAAQGLRLDHFYSASPVCSPTRGSVITGRHPNRYGTFTPNWSIRPEEISVAQLLADAGYTCGHFGKWHLGPVKADSPTNPGAMGFHQWLSHDNFFEMNPILSRNGGAPERMEGESSEILISETIRFIAQAKTQQKPFFAVVWFGSPHEPYSGLPQDLALYDDLPARYADQQVTVTSMETGRPVKRPLGDVLRERYAEITAMDRSLGQLREYLDQEALRDQTLLWYCGDNGTPSGASITTPLRGQKGQMYEGGVRVPGIIEWPAVIDSPRKTSVPAVTSDMLPTLCDLLGLPVPDRPLDGISLRPLIEGRMKQRPSPICFWTYNGNRDVNRGFKPYIPAHLQAGTTPLVKMMAGRYTRNFQNLHHPSIVPDDYTGPRAIFDGRYKLVVAGKNADGESRELFDLRSDPAEQTDLFAERREIADRLQGQLKDWQTSVLRSLTGGDYQ